MAFCVLFILILLTLMINDTTSYRYNVLRQFLNHNVHVSNISDLDLKSDEQFLGLMRTFLEIMRLHFLNDATSYWNERENSTRKTDLVFARSEISQQLKEIFNDNDNVKIIQPSDWMETYSMGKPHLHFDVRYTTTTLDYKYFTRLENKGFTKSSDNNYEKITMNGIQVTIRITNMKEEIFNFKQSLDTTISQDEKMLILYAQHMFYINENWENIVSLQKKS